MVFLNDRNQQSRKLYNSQALTYSQAMSLIEELRPFVSFCQATGLIPFTLKRDLIKTGSLVFSFSFKNFTTWWFIIILLLQLTFMTVMGSILPDLMSDYYIGEAIPVTIGLLGVSSIACSLATIISARWIVLRRYRSMKIALNIVQDIEYRHGLDFHKQSSLMARFTVGAVLVMSTVR